MSDSQPNYREDPPAHPYAWEPRRDGTVACRECGDSGWIEVSRVGVGVVEPCRCRTAARERWESGAWNPSWVPPVKG